MKEKITQTLFIIIFIGSVFQGITTDSLYLLSFSLFTAGCSGAILAGALLKYFSQHERDMRDMKRERKLISKQKSTKSKTIKSSKIGVKNFAVRK
jgi:hypothetical protein